MVYNVVSVSGVRQGGAVMYILRRRRQIKLYLHNFHGREAV